MTISFLGRQLLPVTLLYSITLRKGQGNNISSLQECCPLVEENKARMRDDAPWLYLSTIAYDVKELYFP
jgi:hypothetical protein